MRMYRYNFYQKMNVNYIFLDSIQEIFRDSLHSSELRLRVIKHKNNMDLQTSQSLVVGNKKQPPPPVFPKPSTNANPPFSNKENVTAESSSKDSKCIIFLNFI